MPRTMINDETQIRVATLADTVAIEQLIALSVRGLSRQDYNDQQIEAAIHDIFGVDSELLSDGSYFVAETNASIIGCGGWSKRRTLFGGDRFALRDSTELDPNREAAKIRAFFVHPEHARRGVASRLLAACEAAALLAGFRELELMSTLPGVRFYEAHGYQGSALVVHELKANLQIAFQPMSKRLI